MSERLPTLLDEVGTLPPELMPDNFDGIKFFSRLSEDVRSGEIDKQQFHLRIVGELARRAFNKTAKESCYICSQRAEEYQRYVDGFPLNDPRD